MRLPFIDSEKGKKKNRKRKKGKRRLCLLYHSISMVENLGVWKTIYRHPDPKNNQNTCRDGH